MLRRVLYLVLSLSLILGMWITYTAFPPYEMPQSTYLSPGARFVPQVGARSGFQPKVIVLVFDGLSPAAVAAADTPNLDRMALEGAHTTDLMPSFPTLSLPNHFTLTTGCHPDRHGIVSNHFVDPDRGFYVAKGDADWIHECEPLHVVAERQGVRSAVFSWVGNTSSSRGQLATVAEAFRSPPRGAQEQMNAVIAQLDADPPIGFIATYVTEPDQTAHEHGPIAPATIAMTEQMDTQIGRVIKAIEVRGLGEAASLIVTTDHGMVDVEGMLNLDGIVRRAGIEALVVGEGVMGHVYLDDSDDREAALRALSGGSHYSVFDPTRPPANAHLGRSDRLGDLVIIPNQGYWMADLAHWPWYLRWSSYTSGEVIDSSLFKGMHGYDPEQVPGVRAVFYAWGRSVPAAVELTGMTSVDVHPTVTHLLGVGPGSPVDGHVHEAFLRDREARDRAPEDEARSL